jgi:hypothetical protein
VYLRGTHAQGSEFTIKSVNLYRAFSRMPRRIRFAEQIVSRTICRANR